MLFSVVTVVAALVIVSLMDLALMGRITADYLLTGLVTAGIVASASLFLMNALLREISRQQQQYLSRGVESAEARLQVALDSSDEGVLMVAADGRVLSANKRFFELWRVPPELAAAGQDDLLQAHVLDQLSDPDGFLAGVKRLYGSDAQATDTLRFKDGRVFERFTRALALGAEQGRIWCFRDMSVQAHTREALAEREELYQAIVNQAADGIELVDAETLRFLEVNEAACRMLGYGRDELVGQSLITTQVRQDEAALRDAVAEIVRAGQASIEIRHRCKDGRVLDVRINVRAIQLLGRTCLLGVWRDIGQSKAVALALKESRDLLKVIIDTAPMRVFWKDQNLRYLGCNPAFARDAGKTHPDELIGKDDFEMAWAEQAELYRADDCAVMASGVPRISFDEPQTTPDGRTIWLRTSKVPLKDGDNRTIGVMGVYEDITEQKQVEIALREREELFSAVVNRSVEGILLIDAETMEFIEFNDAACEGLGYTREEFSRLRLPDVQGTMSREETLEKCRVAANTPSGLSFENRHRCKDGSLRHWHVSTRPVQVRGRTCLAHVWHDVTEQKHAMQVLADSALFLRETQSIAHVGGWKVNPVTDMLQWTEEVYRLVEHPLDNPPRGLEEGLRYYAPEYLPEIRRLSSVAWKQGTPFTFETEVIAASGRRFWAELRCVGRVETGSEAYLVGTFQDITERKRLAGELIQREQYQRALLDNFPFMVWLKDEESRFLAVNETFAKVFGWPSAESLSGKTDLDIAPAELAELYRADDRAVLQSGRSKQVEELVETDGRRTWFETYKSPVSIGGRVIGTVGFGRDITERKDAERNLKLAVEVTQVILWEMDVPSQKLKFDWNMLPVLGLQADEDLATLTAWLQRVHPDEAGQFMERFQAALQPDAVFDMEYRLRSKDGDYRWIHTRGSVIQRSQDGQPELAVGTSMNIAARKQIEQAVRESEQYSRNLATLLRLMADNVPDMIWAKDLDKRYLFANRAMCQQLLNATDTDEPMGKTDMFFALRERERHPDNPGWHTFGELCQDSDAITLERGTASVFEEFGNLKGRLTYLDVRKAPFLNEAGEIIGTVGSARDITTRKETDAELERHRRHLEELVQQRTGELLATEARATRILESSADGLYGVDSDSRITFINPAACQMLGYSAEQVMGRSAHELFHHSHADGSPYPAAECLARQAWRAGRESRVADETYWHADGRPVPVTLASRPIIDNGRIVGAVVSVVDVSLQRAAAEAREKALVAAENLARARSEFLANMSHEIRTPMNGVLGFAQIGKRNHKDPDKARNAFEKILTSGNQLLGVVNEILDFSKIEAGQMHVEARELPLGEVLDHALELVAERAHAKGLDLRLEKGADLPSTCVSDPLRVGQILLNLLTNAVKFTETGSVTLSASLQDGQLVFRVTDTGIGMSEEQLGYVFNPFQQADGSTTRKFGGTGLGLAICKRLLELMQGDIRVDSIPGAGSRFEVRLPYVEPPPHADIAAANTVILADKPLKGISILLAEDDPINQMVLEVNLREDGAHLVKVGDGATAVERVIADGPQAYDIVLMDLQMPVMDGYEATRRILELAPALPIIGQTAHAFDEDREKCLAAGMAAHIAKPIDPLALVKLVLQVLAERRRS
jgi:PAS domain S-box-containing protein